MGGFDRSPRALGVTIAASLFCACACASCGPPPPLPTAAATTAQDTRSIEARLQGRWHLQDYRPDVPLEPMLQMLLASQAQTMVITFESGRLRADAATLHVDRAFRVTYAAGPYFKLESPDSSGAMVQSNATMSDDGQSVAFRTESEPWRGSGTIVRVP